MRSFTVILHPNIPKKGKNYEKWEHGNTTMHDKSQVHQVHSHIDLGGCIAIQLQAQNKLVPYCIDPNTIKWTLQNIYS